MKVYQYTGCRQVKKSERFPFIQPGDFLLEGNEQLDMKVPIPCITAGREPFEHVDDVPEVGDINDRNELAKVAEGMRDFVRGENYPSLKWVKPSIEKLRKISVDQFDCDLDPPPAWYGLEKDQLKVWLTKLILWAESKPVPVTPVLEKKKRAGGRKKKADTDNGIRIIAALCKHHEYENCKVGNRKPGSLPEIAKLAGIPKSNKKAVSDFMIKNFGSHAQYKDECRKKDIDLKLAQWQGELIPHVQGLLRDEDGAIRVHPTMTKRHD